MSSNKEDMSILMLCEFSDHSGFYSGYTVCLGSVKQWIKRLVFLNALIPAHGYLIYTRKINIETLRKLLEIAEPEIISFIGHQSTAKLLTDMLKVEIPANRGMWKPEKKEEFVVVVRLKKRLAKPEDVKNITENDIEVWWVHYVSPHSTPLV